MRMTSYKYTTPALTKLQYQKHKKGLGGTVKCPFYTILKNCLLDGI